MAPPLSVPLRKPTTFSWSHSLSFTVHADEAIARSQADTPDIDGVVHLAHPAELEVHGLVTVIVQDADDYDLFA